MACVLFGTASENVLLNLSALTPKTTQVTPTDGALADDTCVDGLIPDRVRIKAPQVMMIQSARAMGFPAG